MTFRALWCGPYRINQPDLNAVDALLPDDEVMLVGVNIEDTEVNALAHLVEFAVPYLSVFDPVNRLAGRFEGIGACTTPSTVFVDSEGGWLPGFSGSRTHERLWDWSTQSHADA